VCCPRLRLFLRVPTGKLIFLIIRQSGTAKHFQQGSRNARCTCHLQRLGLGLGWPDWEQESRKLSSSSSSSSEFGRVSRGTRMGDGSGLRRLELASSCRWVAVRSEIYIATCTDRPHSTLIKDDRTLGCKRSGDLPVSQTFCWGLN